MAAKKKTAKKAATAKTPAKKPAKKAAKKAAKKKVDPIAPGYTAVTPALNMVDARATIEFCKKAFGAKLQLSMARPDGKLMHAVLSIGGALLMVSDAIQDAPRVSSLFLYVPNVDKTVAKAVALGAKVLMPPGDMFWGDRFARICDPQGNFWSIGTHIEDVSPAEQKKRGKAEMKRTAAGAGG